MFEALKRIGPIGQGNKSRRPAEELTALLEAARKERTDLATALTQIETRGAKLTQVGDALEQVEKKAASAAERLGNLDARLAGLDGRTRAVEEVARRIDGLSERTAKAEQLMDQVTSSTGELTKHREMMQTLSSQALQTQATVETLKEEQVALENMRSEMRHVQADVKQSIDQMVAFKTDLDQVRTVGVQLTQDYTRLKEASGEGQKRVASTLDAVKEVEKKLERLDALRALSKDTEERLVALNALAEHISAKTKALETQKNALDRAVVEANRVNELVWSMDAQIAKLTEAGKEMTRAEELVARLETLAKDTTGQVDVAIRAKDDLARELVKIRKDGQDFADFGRGYLERLALLKKEFDSFDQRVRTLQASLADSEGRMDGLVARDKSLATLGARIDASNKQADDLAARAEEIAEKVAALDALADRLNQVDELSKKTTWQMEVLKRNREDVEALRKQFEEVSRLFADTAQLRDRLAADRAGLEATAERLTAFRTNSAELEGKMDAIIAKMQLVDESARKAARFDEVHADIDRQLTRLNTRAELVTKLEERLNALHGFGDEVNRKMEAQLAQRSELDSMKTLLEGVAALASDAQMKLDGVSALQTKLLPLATQVGALKSSIEKLTSETERMHEQGRFIAEQEKRLAELAETGGSMATAVDERLRQIQGLSEELKRATAVKDELIAELGRVQGRQREVAAQAEASEDQIKRVESLSGQLDNRRVQLAFSEKKIAAFEARLNDLKQASEDIERKIQELAAREAVVAAVRAEAESVREVAVGAKADFEHVAAHRAEITVLKGQVGDLLECISEIDDKIALVESRKALVNEVRLQANMIVNMLSDVRSTLETVSEQRAIVDDTAEKVAKLDFAVQEANNTLRALQRERELAERIEHGIQQLRAHTGGEPEKKRA